MKELTFEQKLKCKQRALETYKALLKRKEKRRLKQKLHEQDINSHVIENMYKCKNAVRRK